MGPVVYFNVSFYIGIETVTCTVMASPSIFASGVDHFRSVPDEVDVDDDDSRFAHCAERRGKPLACE
jgi:hypothetical protein